MSGRMKITAKDIDQLKRTLRLHFHGKVIDEACRLAKLGLLKARLPEGLVELRHIGDTRALCDRRKPASLRKDLGRNRYLKLGTIERLKGEGPYVVCPRCIDKLPRG